MSLRILCAKVALAVGLISGIAASYWTVAALVFSVCGLVHGGMAELAQVKLLGSGLFPAPSPGLKQADETLCGYENLGAAILGSVLAVATVPLVFRAWQRAFVTRLGWMTQYQADHIFDNDPGF